MATAEILTNLIAHNYEAALDAFIKECNNPFFKLDMRNTCISLWLNDDNRRNLISLRFYELPEKVRRYIHAAENVTNTQKSIVQFEFEGKQTHVQFGKLQKFLKYCCRPDLREKWHHDVSLSTLVLWQDYTAIPLFLKYHREWEEAVLNVSDKYEEEMIKQLKGKKIDELFISAFLIHRGTKFVSCLDLTKSNMSDVITRFHFTMRYRGNYTTELYSDLEKESNDFLKKFGW